MTLHACDLITISEETVRVAQAAFPKGNVYMTMRDRLGLWYKDSEYAYLFQSTQGRPAESPGRLNLVLIMQYAEGLTDEQAAEAVRSRIDWKYALGLTLTDPGFHYSILSDYRQRLLSGGAEQQLLNDMLSQFQAAGLLKARGKQRTDSSHVLGAIRDLNRLECIGETLRHTLNILAEEAPDWLLTQVGADWFELYGPRFEQYRLPKTKSEQQALAERIGHDGFHLLAAIDAETAPACLQDLPGVQVLRQVWEQQFILTQQQVQLRTGDDRLPAAETIESPYDIEARYSAKRQTEWTGYKVHLTETCDDDCPHLITNVETTTATIPDGNLTDTLHSHLAEKGLLPREHFLDAGYVDAHELVLAQSQYDVDLVGPVRADTSWQAQANQGFDLTCFRINWPAHYVTCPQGHRSKYWRSRLDSYGNEAIEVYFDAADCTACAARVTCTRAKQGPRTLKLRAQAEHIALQNARQYQTTADFKERYKKRAGVEGTVSQGTRCFNLRRARYVGLAKTRLQHVITAAAINLTRAVFWLQDSKFAQTRCSRFAALAPT